MLIPLRQNENDRRIVTKTNTEGNGRIVLLHVCEQRQDACSKPTVARTSFVSWVEGLLSMR